MKNQLLNIHREVISKTPGYIANGESLQFRHPADGRLKLLQTFTVDGEAYRVTELGPPWEFHGERWDTIRAITVRSERAKESMLSGRFGEAVSYLPRVNEKGILLRNPPHVDEARLSASAFRVLFHLSRYDPDRPDDFPGVRSIAERCRMNKDTVGVAVKELESAGLVRCIRAHGCKNQYFLQQ